MALDAQAEKVVAHLEELDARFEILEIDPGFADTAAFCERYGWGLDVSANAIVVASRRPVGRVAVCVALATTRLDVNHRVRRLLDVSKVSFADEEATRELTGMELGGVSPFGLPDGVPVFVDDRVTRLDRCVIGGGSRSIKLVIDPEVFARLPDAEVIGDLAR